MIGPNVPNLNLPQKKIHLLFGSFSSTLAFGAVVSTARISLV
jgi:hypothetical protein